jgi:hypothetical protein
MTKHENEECIFTNERTQLTKTKPTERISVSTCQTVIVSEGVLPGRARRLAIRAVTLGAYLPAIVSDPLLDVFFLCMTCWLKEMSPPKYTMFY